jgi:hypothetical protein
MKSRKGQRYDINTHSVHFEVSIRWDKADVDACIVPHLSAFCGKVSHEIQNPNQTPTTESVEHVLHILLMDANIYPDGVYAKESYGLMQGYASITLEYAGELDRLKEVIAQCEKIVSKHISKYVTYYREKAAVSNSCINAYAGTGSGISRVL